VVSDFDGTLARLVSDPWGATIVPAAQRALRRLAATPGVSVALLSGRGVADLAGRARVGGISYLGDHGAERADAVRGFRPQALSIRRESAPAAAGAMARLLAERVPQAIPDTWLVVEAKGSALTFHFRAAGDLADARTRVRTAVDDIDPDGVLVRWAGRRSLELRPADASHKGAALQSLIEEKHPGAVIVLGDDHSDVRAFEVLRSKRARGHVEGLAVAVAGHPDVSADVAPSADVLLPSPVAAGTFLGLLASLARRHREAGPRPRST